MNYGQFLHMLPEASLVLALVIMFFADLMLGKGKKKVQKSLKKQKRKWL